jgi:hypothetical protein
MTLATISNYLYAMEYLYVKLILKTMLSSDENHDNGTNKDKKVIEAAEELKKEQRESEQLNVDPEQVLEEEEKRQPHSVEDE